MAITYPRALNSFADTLKIASVTWKLQEQQEISMLGSGEIIAGDMGPSLWTGEVSLVPADHADARAVQADIETLEGSMQTFFLYDPRAIYPIDDPTGSKLGAANPVISSINPNNKALIVSGLPALYNLSKGDMLSFNYGTSPVRRALHRIVETVTASGAGVSPSFEVRPHIRPGATAGIAVSLIKPAAKVRLFPGSFEEGQGAPVITSGMSFRVIQTLG
ncbi:hypothetical protein GA830_12205 [Mesorhizobium sp. NBSH29]|uniref:hypothetical protein n=1 Tax=Mesorhizobium sp. NBSH29 TaxID=2654249 RepID=UPI00189664EB|nr:hypothetical protein [Mesorhizobium sp. NBSH29]QPC87420.1 hypothetical protein GA830_12205 [Mesorhizobium sp. NBSH29]